MPDLFTREQNKIEKQLFDAMESTRQLYQARAATQAEYMDAVKAFNDFALSGKLPDEQSPLSKTASS